MSGVSRYIEEITEYAIRLKAKAAYCFVVDGVKGTGGCPLIMGVEALEPAVYQARCEELIAMLRRSADMLESDLVRQGFRGPRCAKHEAALVNEAFFACGCQHISPPPEEPPA